MSLRQVLVRFLADNTFDFRSGYCQQTDTHMTSCTVKEALLFSAKMRQPAHVPIAEKEA